MTEDVFVFIVVLVVAVFAFDFLRNWWKESAWKRRHRPPPQDRD